MVFYHFPSPLKISIKSHTLREQIHAF